MQAAPLERTKQTATGFANLRNSEKHETNGETLEFTSLVKELRRNWSSRKSWSYDYRIQELNNLRRGMVELSDEIVQAVAEDLRKHVNEAFQSEVGLVVSEIDFAIDNLKSWMEPTRVSVPMYLHPSSGVIYKQPKGVALIVGAWNFPIHLTIIPLIAAIAAGCAVVVKPSEVTVVSSKVIEKLLTQYLDPDFIRCVQGGVPETTALLNQNWNHIFYTGNGAVGKIVGRAAAETLCSATLELGGKSPVYVSEHANVRVAARRVLGTKVFNNGQVCVAPDYAMVHESVVDQFNKELVKHYELWFRGSPETSASLTRFPNQRHWERVSSMVSENHGGRVLLGGMDKANPSECYMAPTVVLNPRHDSRMMQEEIFGPVLPVLTVKSLDEALDIINSKESSLASYIFTENSAEADRFLQFTNSGGSCVNDCLMHLGPSDLPFGGHSGGGSGVGTYHGKAGFDEFTHTRSTLHRTTWLDPDARYPPYNEKAVGAMRLLFLGSGIPSYVFTGMKVAAAGMAALAIKSRL